MVCSIFNFSNLICDLKSKLIITLELKFGYFFNKSKSNVSSKIKIEFSFLELPYFIIIFLINHKNQLFLDISINF